MARFSEKIVSDPIYYIYYPGFKISRLNGWPVGVPCQRFAAYLTMVNA